MPFWVLLMHGRKQSKRRFCPGFRGMNWKNSSGLDRHFLDIMPRKMRREFSIWGIFALDPSSDCERIIVRSRRGISRRRSSGIARSSPHANRAMLGSHANAEGSCMQAGSAKAADSPGPAIPVPLLFIVFRQPSDSCHLLFSGPD